MQDILIFFFIECTLLPNNLAVTYATLGWMSVIQPIFTFYWITIISITYSVIKTYTMDFFFPLHHVISYKPRWTSIQVSHSLIRFIITDLPSLQFSPVYPGRHSHLPPTQMPLFWHGLLSHWSVITNNQSALWANSWIDTWFFWIMFNVIWFREFCGWLSYLEYEQ